MNRFIYILLLTGFININLVAATDPMVSLFKFQSQMAAAGNAEAMMKLGEMYEEGVGTKQDLNKALEMYKQAQSKGQKEAAKAIRRVEGIKKKGLRNLELERQKKIAREQAAKDKAVRNKAAREKAARDKLARDKAARDKAARDKLARDKAARDKAARDKRVRDKAAKDKRAREQAVKAKKGKSTTPLSKAEKEKLAREKEAKAKAAREKALRDYEARRQKAAGGAKVVKDKPVELKPVPMPVVKKEAENVDPFEDEDGDDAGDDGFSSNPCDSPAARFMPSCKKK